MLPKRKATGGRRSLDYSIQPTLFSQYLLSSREIKSGRAKRSPGYVKMALLVLVLTFFGLPKPSSPCLKFHRPPKPDQAQITYSVID